MTNDSPRPGRAFWLTICALALASLNLALIAVLRPPAPQEWPASRLETLLRDSAAEAEAAAADQLDPLLAQVYAPVHAAVPAYADFHYSVWGEYVELGQAAFGEMEQALQQRLFDGFSERLDLALSTLDAGYANAFAASVDARLQTAASAGGAPLGPLSDTAIANTMARARISAPVAGVAGLAGSGALKLLAKGVAKKVSAKIAAKAAAKAGAKGSGVLAGAGGGAALCAWSGPGAALCGVVGGAAAWLLADAALIKLDEILHRDAFEAELHALIDQDRALRTAALRAALARKTQQVLPDTQDQPITLRDLARPAAPETSGHRGLDPAQDGRPQHRQ